MGQVQPDLPPSLPWPTAPMLAQVYLQTLRLIFWKYRHILKAMDSIWALTARLVHMTLWQMAQQISMFLPERLHMSILSALGARSILTRCKMGERCLFPHAILQRAQGIPQQMSV